MTRTSQKGKGDGIPQTSDQKELWDYFQEKQATSGSTNFFGQIKIDKQAGFDELEEMWGNGRYLFGAVAASMLILNVYFIISIAVTLIEDARDTQREACIPEYSFLISKETWAGPVVKFLKGSVWENLNVPDRAQGLVAVALLELLLLATMLIWGTINFVKIFTSTTECKKWHNVANFFFNVFPMISTLSLVKLLNYVTPAVVVPDLLAAIKATFTTATGSCALVWFVGTRLFCFLFGFDAFLYKFQVIAHTWRINSGQVDGVDPVLCEADDRLAVLLATLTFVNQLLGIVQLGWFTKQRIFVFIFAGEDGQMSEKERAIKLTFDATLCYKIYEKHGLQKAVFFWLSYSDADFQKMVLDSADDNSGEEASAERERAASVAKDEPLIG